MDIMIQNNWKLVSINENLFTQFKDGYEVIKKVKITTYVDKDGVEYEDVETMIEDRPMQQPLKLLFM